MAKGSGFTIYVAEASLAVKDARIRRRCLRSSCARRETVRVTSSTLDIISMLRESRFALINS